MATIERAELIRFDYGAGTRFAVRLTTVDGAEGAYVPLWSAPPYSADQVIALCRRLIGADSNAREALWDMANRVHSKLDRIGYSAIDIALWDLLGKQTGLPIADLLGRYRSRLPAYASSVSGRQSPDDDLASPQSYADFARDCLAHNVPAFKIHGPVGATLADEIAVVRAVAGAVGDRMDVMTDPGKGLPTLAQALALGRACDDAGLFWWEDPMRDNAPHGHRILRERVRTPLLLTEMVRGLEMRAEIALAGGTDFLRADPELDMGITGVMKTAHIAEGLGIDLEVHAAGPAQRHCMAAIRNTNYYELGLLHPTRGNPALPPVFAGTYRDDLADVGADGCVGVPDGPGLGVTYDWEFIEAHAIDRVRETGKN